MSAAMLLDFDRSVVWFGASCLEVQWGKGGQRGAVRPVFFARTSGGERLVFVHPWAPGLAGAYEEEAVRRAAADAHWTVKTVQVPQGMRRDSLSRAAHYRNPQYAEPQARQALLKAFDQPRPLAAGAAASKAPGALSCTWHLLWTGELAADWQRPLTPASMVWTHPKDKE
ncbi:hypothetical protein ACFW81_07345 [Streptomyces angustmyceticus]|uniref:hypothetical protein n=1 Tax=Streptomyces angustmyceticus TaxID=285578 RepID=UPI0021AF8A13|nr:hypothetical protein [Streptomyces angustmyceticus]